MDSNGPLAALIASYFAGGALPGASFTSTSSAMKGVVAHRPGRGTKRLLQDSENSGRVAAGRRAGGLR